MPNNPITRPGIAQQLEGLCRGDLPIMTACLTEARGRWLLLCCCVIIAGCGAYGATLGLWRDPLQSLYSAIKFPAVILLTIGANALFNGMLAQLLGLGLTFRQTFLALLMGFTLAAIILASFAPIALFILWNTPSLTEPESMSAHLFMKLAHVVVIAFAGILATCRLHQLLVGVSGSPSRARSVLIGWMIGSLFLGAQVSWLLRPFIGSPFLDVVFLRDDAFHGNFYENVFNSIGELIKTILD